MCPHALLILAQHDEATGGNRDALGELEVVALVPKMPARHVERLVPKIVELHPVARIEVVAGVVADFVERDQRRSGGSYRCETGRDRVVGRQEFHYSLRRGQVSV